jgi:hypothetical protein
MKRFMRSLIEALAVLAATNAYATNWTNGSGTCLWGDAGNWNGGLPTSGSTAVINSRINAPGWTTIGDPIIAAGTTASAWHLDLGNDAWSEGTLIVNGTLNSTAIMMGYYQPHWQPNDENVGNTGILTINAGGVVNNSDVTMVGREGNGILNMNGGTLNTAGLTIADYSHSVSTVYLNAGQINVAWEFTMTSFYSPNGHGSGLMVIDNGALKIADEDGSRIARLNTYIANGWIQAAAGKSLVITREGTSDILTAIPEPFIMSMLVLGGLLVSRNRK